MASISNNYEINIAKKRNPDDQYGIHWGRVEIPDSFPDQAEEKLKFLRELFGEGWHISMTYWKCSGSREDSWE